MRLAFYKDKGNFYDKLIRWYTDSPYSHCELVFSDGSFFSSSPRDGGVRFKVINPCPAQWDFIDLPLTLEQESMCRKIAALYEGKKYDWLGIYLSQIIKLNLQDRKRWFCSEIIIRVLQTVGLFIDEIAERNSPEDLHVIAGKLIGGRK